MDKIKITLPLDGHAGMKELVFGFNKKEDDFGYNADINVWVKQNDSISAMRTEGAQKARVFLQQILDILNTGYPESK